MFNPAATAAKPELGTRAYIVAVLWMHGRATTEIAKVVDWSAGQVRGFVNREFKPARDHMTDEQRADRLAELKSDRRDGGRLKPEHFEPIPIMGKPAPRASALTALKREWVSALVTAWAIDDPVRQDIAFVEIGASIRSRFDEHLKDTSRSDLSTKEGRREFRQVESQVMKAVKEAREQKRLRERGLATSRGITAAALEYLFENHLLRDGRASKDKLKDPEEQRRYSAGVKLRAYFDGMRLGGLGAFDYERATMGGGGDPGISLSAYKIQCITSLGSIRKMICDADFGIVEAVVDHDKFLWEREKSGSRERSMIYDGIRYGLDVVAVHESLMTHEEFKVRWGEELPALDRQTRADAVKKADAASEFFQQARMA